MTGDIANVLRHLRAVIEAADQGSVRARVARDAAERACMAYAEAAAGVSHTQANLAEQEARVAADKAAKLARLLAEAATAFAEYVNVLVAGTVPVAISAPGGLPTGGDLIRTSGQGTLSRRLGARLASTQNADDGMDGFRGVVNTVQDALAPGGVVVHQSPTPVVRGTHLEGGHAGDALLATLTLAILGVKATELVAQLRRQARADRSDHDQEDRQDE